MSADWRATNQSTLLLACEDGACEGGAIPSGQDPLEPSGAANGPMCIAAHTGPLCTLCSDGFARGAAGACVDCETAHGPTVTAVSVMVSILAIALLLALAVVLYRQRAVRKNAAREDTTATSDESSSKQPSAAKKLIAAAAHTWALAKVKVTLLVSMTQVITLLGGTLQLRWPSAYEEAATARKGAVYGAN